MIFNTLLIGLGNIGLLYDFQSKNIQTHSKAITLNKNFKLVGAIEPKEARRVIFLNKFKIKPFSKIKKDLVLKSKLIVISSTTSSLFNNLTKVININPKLNILIEKPFGFTEKEISYIKKKFKNNKIYINYYRNFDKKNLLLKKIIFNKLKGPFNGSLNYNKGFFHNCSHFLALFLFFFGKIKKVKIVDKIKIKNDYYIKAIIYYNNFELLISPSVKNIDCSFKIFGKKGKLNYDNDGSSIYYTLFNKMGIFKSKRIKFLNNISNYQKEVYENIYKDLLNKKSKVFDKKQILELNKEIKKFKL